MIRKLATNSISFLLGLFLDHGRNAYRRVAWFMCYYFYKNIAICFVDALWTNFCGYSGQIVFPEFMTMMFNAVWTSTSADINCLADGSCVCCGDTD